MIAAKKINKNFSEPVLRDVTIFAMPGEICGIAGENGSGKSTLLSILAGLIPPDSGELDLPSRIGYVPQEAALFDNLSVRDNILFWSAVSRVPPGPIFCEDVYKKKVKHLSGGMRKRLSIALACLNDPECLIMDEPTAALDIGFKGELAQMMRDMRSEGRSIVFSSHQPDELLWCDRIYILRGGVFVYEGSPHEITDLPGALYGAGDKGIYPGL